MPIPLIAVDIGNSRIKLGRFAPGENAGLPAPQTTLELSVRDDGWETPLAEWAAQQPQPAQWIVASVNRPHRERLAAWLAAARPNDPLRQLDYRRVPLQIALSEPERIGIDRLLGAVAANTLRAAGQMAVVVDLGSAITVDVVSADGAFLGGAILPGIGMAARALHEQTDLLPEVALRELHEPPPPLGTSTVAAIHSGLYWGAVGAVRELVTRCTASASAPPLVLITGGAAPAVARLVSEQARYEPHLILAGIALALQSDASA